MESRLLIVTTFFNENSRLKQTLENMRKQNYSDFVHLIIDDGSESDLADDIVKEYINQSKHRVVFEKHKNEGINLVHMHAFMRTLEFDCTHFMWIDCGDKLKENAVYTINKLINKFPRIWLHLDGYYVSNEGKKVTRMSSRSYKPYLAKKDQFLPFCFSISTYGHFVIPFNVYETLNPDFELVDGFYYDAQIVGALSLNSCPQHFVREPLSIIEDDQHYSVTNSSVNSYRSNLLELSNFVVADSIKCKRISDLSMGINDISIRKLFNGGSFTSNRENIIALKKFYKTNKIKITDRYKWFDLLLISLFHFC